MDPSAMRDISVRIRVVAVQCFSLSEALVYVEAARDDGES